MSKLDEVHDAFGDKLSPPYYREDILEDDSVRAYLEDKVCGAVKKIADVAYGKDVSELSFQIDGRMRTTKIAVRVRKERKFRINPSIFEYTAWETIKLLREAVGIYLEAREG